MTIEQTPSPATAPGPDPGPEAAREPAGDLVATVKATPPAPPAPPPDEEDRGEVHVLPFRLYLAVYGGLLGLTALTVGVSIAGLGRFAIAAALTVAVLKAGLVIAYFMHLKYDVTFYSLAFFSSLIFVGLFLGLTLVDMTTRASMNPEEETFYKRKEDQEKRDALQRAKRSPPPPPPDAGAGLPPASGRRP